jgi:hypothetical protein
MSDCGQWRETVKDHKHLLFNADISQSEEIATLKSFGYQIGNSYIIVNYE